MPEQQPSTPPTPAETESFNSGYDYSARFPDLRDVYGSEGGSVYAADLADGFYVITDEGFWADFNVDVEPTISILRFDSAADRDAYCRIRFPTRSRPDIPEG